MGEAKHRKLNDPNYGKPSRMRGLIISTPLILDGNTIVESRPIDGQDLRSSLMYWDRLAWPSTNIIGWEPDPDIDFLEAAGVLYRPRSEMWGRINIEYALTSAQTNALIEYEKKEKGVWSISGGANSIVTKQPPNNNGALIQLLNSVPVPAETVPLAEILEFKAKRRDELLSFRAHLEGLTAKIAASPDSVEALHKALAEVDAACADLVKTTREWQCPVKLGDTHASFNFDITKAAGAAGAVFAALAKSPFALSATTTAVTAGSAAVLSQFKLTSDFAFQKIKRPSSPFRYSYFVQRDLN